MQTRRKCKTQAVRHGDERPTAVSIHCIEGEHEAGWQRLLADLLGFPSFSSFSGNTHREREKNTMLTCQTRTPKLIIHLRKRFLITDSYYRFLASLQRALTLNFWLLQNILLLVKKFVRVYCFPSPCYRHWMILDDLLTPFSLLTSKLEVKRALNEAFKTFINLSSSGLDIYRLRALNLQISIWIVL